MNWSHKEMEKILELIDDMAKKDATFRTLCFTDGNAAIESISDKLMPAEMVINFTENNQSQLYYSIGEIEEIDGELSDTALAQITAGEGKPLKSSENEAYLKQWFLNESCNT